MAYTLSRLAGWAALLFLVTQPLLCMQCGETDYQCALFYIGRQDFPNALQSLQRVLQREPRNLKALNLLGIALTASGEIEKANREYTKALKIDPHFCPALKNLAINELTLKRTADAKAHMEQVLRSIPNDEVINLFLGEIYFAEQQCGPALTHYNRSRVRIIGDPTLILHFGECALEQQQRPAAITMLDLLPATSRESQLEAGLMLAHAGVYTEAAAHFALARKISSDKYAAGYNEILAYVKAEHYPAAIQTAKELFAAGFERAELYNLVSQAFLKSGQLKEACDALRRATDLAPDDPTNYIDLAWICMDYGNYDLGIEITDIGLQHIPNSERLYFQRGAMRAMKGEVAESVRDFEKAAQLAPEKNLPYIALAIAWMQLGEVQKTIDLLRERVKRSPGDFLVHYMLGEALMRSGANVGSAAENEAMEAFERSISLNPQFVQPRAELGKILLKRGEVDRAIGQLEKARALDPSDPGPTYQLAQAYRKKGDRARAEELMGRLSKIHEQDRNAEMKKALRGLVREDRQATLNERSSP
jgi:tetratricopeptide (TPR) repeat protein